MCIWCGNRWECDGEGGECGGAGDGKGAEGAQEGQAGWVIDKNCDLKSAHNSTVKDPNGNVVKVQIKGWCDGNGAVIVELNGEKVTGNAGGGSGPKKYRPGRNRKWAVNKIVDLKTRDGKPVLDINEEQVRVRVQAYAYDYDATLHKPPHPTGRGPAIRFYATG